MRTVRLNRSSSLEMWASRPRLASDSRGRPSHTSAPAGSYLVVACLLLSWAAVASAQAPPYRLGLVDSWTTRIEVVPDVPVAGLEVLGVVPGSPAARAGLGAGDVILSANAARIVAPDDLRRALGESRGRLLLKVFEARSEQVLNVTVLLGPTAPGGAPWPSPIAVAGRLRVGVVAIGAETTGVTLTTADGTTYDLDFGASRPPDRGSDGRDAVVSGVLAARPRPGPERRDRRIIKVNHFRLIGGGRPRTQGVPKTEPF